MSWELFRPIANSGRNKRRLSYDRSGGLTPIKRAGQEKKLLSGEAGGSCPLAVLGTLLAVRVTPPPPPQQSSKKLSKEFVDFDRSLDETKVLQTLSPGRAPGSALFDRSLDHSWLLEELQTLSTSAPTSHQICISCAADFGFRPRFKCPDPK